jgi:hypothetical protein
MQEMWPRRINPLSTYFVIYGHIMNIFSSEWVEPINISRASIKQVLALALRAGLL